MDSEHDAQPEGFNIWLHFLGVCQGVGVLKLLFGSIFGLEAFGPLIDVPGMRIVIATQAAIDVGAIALSLATLGTLLDRKRSFLKWLLYQWIAIPIIFIMEYGISSVALGVPVLDLVDSGEMKKIATAFVVNGIWVLYTRKSKRVANTMVN